MSVQCIIGATEKRAAARVGTARAVVLVSAAMSPRPALPARRALSRRV